MQLPSLMLTVLTLIWRYQESPPFPHKLVADAVALRLESAPKVAQVRLAVNDLLRLLAALDLRPRTAVTASRRRLHDLLVVAVGVFITALPPGCRSSAV